MLMCPLAYVAPHRRTESVPSAEHAPNVRPHFGEDHPGAIHNAGTTIYETGDPPAEQTLQNRHSAEDSDASKPLVPWFGSGNAKGSGLLGPLEDHPTTLEDENVLTTHPSISRNENATPASLAAPPSALPSTSPPGNPFGSAFSDLLGSARPSATGTPSFNQNLPPPGSFFAQSWNSGSPPVSHKGSGSPPGSLKSIGSAEPSGSTAPTPIGSERERRSAHRKSVSFAPTPPLTPPADDAPVQMQSIQIKRSEPLRFFDPTDAAAYAGAQQQVQERDQQFSPVQQYPPNQQHFQPNHPPRLQQFSPNQSQYQQDHTPPPQQQQHRHQNSTSQPHPPANPALPNLESLRGQLHQAAFSDTSVQQQRTAIKEQMNWEQHALRKELIETAIMGREGDSPLSPTQQQQHLQSVAQQQLNALSVQQQQAFQAEVQRRMIEMERMEKVRFVEAQEEARRKQLEEAQKVAKTEFERAQREQFQQAMALFGFMGTQRMATPSSSIGTPISSQSVSPPPIQQPRGYGPPLSTLQNGLGTNYFNHHHQQQQQQTNAYGFIPQAASGFGPPAVNQHAGHEGINLLVQAAPDHGIVHAPPAHSAQSMMSGGPAVPPLASNGSMPLSGPSSPARNGVASPELPHHSPQHLTQFMQPSPTHRPSSSLPAAQPQQVQGIHHTPSPSLQVQIHEVPSSISQPMARYSTPPVVQAVMPQNQRVSTPVSHPAPVRTPQVPVSVGPMPSRPPPAPVQVAKEIVNSQVAVNQTAASFLLRALDTNPFDIEFVFYRRLDGEEEVKIKGMLASSAWLRGKSEWLDGVLENAFSDGNVIGWDYSPDNDKADGEGKGPAPISPEKMKEGAARKIVLRDVAYRT